MREIVKQKIGALLIALFHLLIPIIIVIMILNIWSEGVDNDASMEWNIFVTVSCFGAALLVFAIAFYIEWIMDKYYWNKFSEKPCHKE